MNATAGRPPSASFPTENDTPSYCVDFSMIINDGTWINSPGDITGITIYAFPALMIQVSMSVIITRALAVGLKPLRLPRIVAEILGGVLMGPSVLGGLKITKTKNFGEIFYPPPTQLTLETAMHVGILYFVFTIGVVIDLEALKRTGRKAVAIAAASVAFPFAITMASAPYLFRNVTKATKHLEAHPTGVSNPDATEEGASTSNFYFSLSLSLSMNAVSVLARILMELNLFNTELGRLTLFSTMMNMMLCSLLMTIGMVVTGGRSGHLGHSALGKVFSGIMYMLLCIYVIRPALQWVARRTPEGRPLDPKYLSSIMIGVLAAATITELLGFYSPIGAFTFGLLVPNGPLAVKVIEMIEESAISFLTTLYFAFTGFKVNISSIRNHRHTLPLLALSVLADTVKLGGTILVTRVYGMPFHNGLSIAFLMNTKGLIHLLMFNVGLEKKALDLGEFSVLVLASVVTTAMVPPVVMAAYKPARQHMVAQKRRNLQLVRPDSELRLLACMHSVKNVPSIISLLDAANPTKSSPIFVCALHLIELIGRASAMLIVHQSSSQQGHQCRAPGNGNAQSEHIVSAFERYEQEAGGVSAQTLTAIASYSTIHEDICALAEDRRVALIILPFEKQSTAQGSSQGEAANPTISTVNRNVLSSASCSVAILVDRGLGVAGRFSGRQQVVSHVVLLFFGGPDDREALAFVSRMAEHPNIGLLVVRFVLGEEAVAAKTPSNLARFPSKERPESRIVTLASPTDDVDKEQDMDNKCISQFRLRHAQNESMAYVEKVVNNCEETVAAIRSIEGVNELYVVGRGNAVTSPMTAGLEEWSECPELGPIADLLVSSDFGAVVSVLVFQQYVVATAKGEEAAVDGGESPGRQYVANADSRDKLHDSGLLSGWHNMA